MVTLAPGDLLAALRRDRLVAIIRGSSGVAAVGCARALFAAGVRLVEVALTTPDALPAIEEIARIADAAGGGAAAGPAGPQAAYVGAGTVLSTDDLHRAVAAGASFVVTPGLAPSVGAAVARGIPVLAGAYTPSEVIAAWDAGVTAVKLIPASAGGPAYLRALRDPLPGVPLIPVGGVGLAEAEQYFRAGALAVGVGGPLVGDAASGGDVGALAERARAFVALTREGGDAR